MLCIYTVFYGLIQWIEAGRGLSAMSAGLMLLPMTVLSGLIVRPVSQRNLLRTPLTMTAASPWPDRPGPGFGSAALELHQKAKLAKLILEC
jgi:hypothetical protein